MSSYVVLLSKVRARLMGKDSTTEMAEMFSKEGQKRCTEARVIFVATFYAKINRI